VRQWKIEAGPLPGSACLHAREGGDEHEGVCAIVLCVR
jgi:hypothetical protein